MIMKEVIDFNDIMVVKYRAYADSVNKDGDNLGFVEYIVNFHLEEYTNDIQHLLKLLQG